MIFELPDRFFLGAVILFKRGYIMADKKLFPGVTEQDVQKQEMEKQEAIKVAEAKRIVLEKAKRAAEEKAAADAAEAKVNAERLEAYKKYLKISDRMPTMFNIKQFCKVNALAAASLFMLGNVSWLFVQSDPYRDSNGHGFVDNPNYKPYKEALHDAYSPINTYEGSGFAPSVAWMINVFLSVCVLVVSSRLLIDTDGKKTVKMMLELEKIGKEYNLDTEEVRRLVNVCKDIIKRMSADKRVYFDMLMSGDISVKDNATFQSMAVSVMSGHLQSHPEDLQMVLDVFDERSMPSEIKAMAAAKER